MIVAIALADPPTAWEALGFVVAEGCVALDGVLVRLGRPGRGIVGWELAGVSPGIELDGLPTILAGDRPAATTAAHHPNGAFALDHVVVITPDFDRTSAALARADLPLRRVREVKPGDGRPGFRQGFRRLGPCILELVETPGADPGGPARFWGLVVVVGDLDALAARLGSRLGPVRPAVQPGRRIATLRAEAGLGAAVAFMDPEAEDRV